MHPWWFSSWSPATTQPKFELDYGFDERDGLCRDCSSAMEPLPGGPLGFEYCRACNEKWAEERGDHVAARGHAASISKGYSR